LLRYPVQGHCSQSRRQLRRRLAVTLQIRCRPPVFAQFLPHRTSGPLLARRSLWSPGPPSCEPGAGDASPSSPIAGTPFRLQQKDRSLVIADTFTRSLTPSRPVGKYHNVRAVAASEPQNNAIKSQSIHRDSNRR
jgi:hypothetical protein